MASLSDYRKKYEEAGSAVPAKNNSLPESSGGGLSAWRSQYAALADYADSFRRYEQGAGTVAKYLQSESWDDNKNQQRYTDLVSSRQEEIQKALTGAGDNALLKRRLQQYADSYGSLAQGLQDREAFFGQFQSAADYGSYASAKKAAKATKAAGKSYDDWYRQTQADAEAASGRVTELKNRLAEARLAASTGLWDGESYLGENKEAAEEARRLQEALAEAQLQEADKKRVSSYARAWRYRDIPESADYEDTAARGLRRFEADSARTNAQEQTARAKREADFNALGTGGLVYEDDLMTQLREDTAWREPTEDWSEEERKTFGYLYARDKEKAYEYGQYLNDTDKAQRRYEQEQAVGTWASKNFGAGVVSTAAGILAMPAAIADYVDYQMEYAARGTTTQRENMSLADYGNTMVASVAERLNEKYGTVDNKFISGFGVGDLYQLGVSIGQSMTWGAAGKALGAAAGLAGEAAAHAGSAATLGIFFGSAAKSGFEDARARGVDDGKALWYGFASGLAEAGCEVLSLDKLLTIKSPTTLGKLFKNILTQAGVEASEELMTTLCNTVSDAVINGDKSELNTKIALGMAKGMSYDEAAKETEKEWLQGIARDALGGFLSGGVSGGVQSGIESGSRYRGSVNSLIEQGLASGGEAERLARNLQERVQRRERTNETTSPQTAEQTAPLAQGSQETQGRQSESQAQGRDAEGVVPYKAGENHSQTQERESEAKRKQKPVRVTNLQAQRIIDAIENSDRGKIKTAVEAQLTRMQEDKDVSLVASAVSKRVQGERLNRLEEEALKESRFGEYLLDQLNVEKLMGGGSIPEWIRGIGAERLGGGLYSDVAEVARSTLRGERLKSAQGRVSVNGERATFTRLEKNKAGETVALITKADGSTRQVSVEELDFGYNTLLGTAVKEMAALNNGAAAFAMYHEGQDLGAYIDAWQIGEIYGSRSSTTFEKAWEAAGKGIRQDIEENQFRQAFDMGRREREERIAAREKEGENRSAHEQTNESESQREGTVSFDGAEIDSVKYDAVDKKRLSQRQKRQIAALEELAKVTGVNIVFYQTKTDGKGRYHGANGAFFNNTIYLDVNAGMRDSRDNLRVAIIRTAAHELTHYIKEHNAEGYEALQGFLLDRLIEWKGRSLKELAEDKLARDTSGTLSMEQATDEVVADGCEMMLRRSSVAEQLAREDKSLFERISDWVKGWTQKIRDAFEGVEAYHDEAKAMEQHAAELQKRWDAALLGAIRNDRSGQATKNTAQEGGAVQFSIDRNFAREIEEWDGVRSKRFRLGRTSNTLKALGVKDREIRLYSGKLGEIYKKHPEMSKDIVKQIPKALEYPRMILQSKEHKSRLVILGELFVENDVPIIAILELTPTTKSGAPLELNVLANAYGKDDSPAEFIRQSGLVYIDSNRNRANQWMQRVGLQLPSGATAYGSIGKITYSGDKVNIQSVPYNQYMQTEREDVSYTSRVPATKTAFQLAYEEAQKKTQLQERDFMPDDRELLLEAAESGQGGATLREYRKKAQKLEEHQRRLQRLQEAAESAEGTEKDKITEKLRKTEKSAQNAENALRKMESTPQVKRALENAIAAWRDENPNDAAKTLRRLREQNRTQQELIEYWQAQAKRTEPGEETMRQDDIRRAARALLKEHQSEADVRELSRLLQELGDFMAKNEAGAGADFYGEVKRRAGRAARLIVENIYQTEDGNADLRESVRAYLRRTPIQITDSIRADMPELDYFRKKNLGTLRLQREGAVLDEVYQSLADQFGDYWFPRDVTAPSDQLNRIMDALEDMEPSYAQMYRDFEAREVSEIIANEIVDIMLSGDIRQSETVADKAYRKALNDAQDEARFRYAELQDEKALRREMVNKKVHELRERSIERDKAYKARIRIAKSANRLSRMLTENSKTRHVPEKLKAALGQFLLSVDTLSPRAGEKTQQMYIRQMDEIRKVVAGSLDYLNGNEGEWKGMLLDLPQDIAEVMQQHIDSIQAAIDGDKTWTTARMSLAELEDLETILTTLSKAIEQQNKLLASERDETVSETAEETIRYLDALARASRDSGLRRFLQYDNTTPYYYFKRFGPAGLRVFRGLQVGYGNFARNTKQIMDFTEKLYTDKEVREAEEKVYTFQLHKRLLAKTENGDEALRSAEKESVRMTKAQIMELYALSRREQALGHILGAGIRIAEFREGKLNKVSQAENYLLTIEELNEITGTLSKREKKIVDELQKFMNTVGSDWGNEISMARFGIRQYTEKNYWPISTDSQGRPVRDPGRDSTNLFRLLNMSFTKNTVRDAHNALVVGSAFDTFANHMADMAKYNALGLPLLDAMKWYSYNAIGEENEDGQYTTRSMQKSANGALGTGATDYFINFMKDLNGAQEAGRGEGAYQKMMSNYKVASVAANIRVAALQPTAFVRAVAVLDPQYMTKGLAMSNRQGQEEALQYSNVALWKDLGYYDTNINAGLREKIKRGEGLKGKIQEKSMVLAEMGDKLTWGAIWNACKAQVEAKQGLSGEALLKATGELFDEVVYRTQVMDSPMTRSQNMRKKGVFAGMTTAFMSEPTLSYNMVLDAYNEYQNEARRNGRKAAWEATRGKLGRAFAAYTATAAAAAFVESFIDALRDDDEYASFAEKWLAAMGFKGNFFDGNLMQDLLIHNKLPFIKDIDSLLHGYSNSRMDLEAVSNMIKAGKIWKETIQLALGTLDKPTDITYNGRMTGWGKLYPTLKAISQLTGFAVGNLSRDMVAIWNNTAGAALGLRVKAYDPGPEKSIQYALQDGNLTEEEARRLLISEGVETNETDAGQKVYEWSLGDADKYDAILNAVKKDDKSAYQTALRELLDHGYAEKNVKSQIKAKLKTWYQGGEDTPRILEKAQTISLLQRYAGLRAHEAEATVKEWSCYIVTGLQYSELKEAYVNGEFGNSVAIERQMTFGGKTREDATAAVLKWQCERDTGVAYDDIRESYIYGDITETQMRGMLEKYGGQSEENIDKAVALYDFVGTDESLNGITNSAALYYYTAAQETGIGKKDWLKYWSAMKDFTGDDTQKQIIAYIDSLRLTPAQKDVLFRFKYHNSEKTLMKTPWHQ